MQIRQSSLSGGELGPQLLGKTDQARYRGSMQTQRNAWITRYGSIENRSGTQFIDAIKTESLPCRLVRFTFGIGVGYLLELSATAIRIYKLGAPISVAGSSTWNNGISYPQGVVVLYSGVYYYSRQPGNFGQQPDISTTFWYPQPVINGVAALEIPAVIPQGALQQLQYVQQNSILIMTHQLMAPQQLTRWSDQQWVLAPYALNIAPVPVISSVTPGFPGTPSVAGPTGFTATGGQASTTKDNYVVTAFNGSSESGPSFDAVSSVGQANSGNPVTLSWTAVAGATGYVIYKGVNPPIIGPWYIIGIVEGVTTFSDPGLTPATSVKIATVPGGTIGTYTYVITAVDANGNEGLPSPAVSAAFASAPTSANPNVIAWVLTGSTQNESFTSVTNAPSFTVPINTPTVASLAGTFVGTLELESSIDGVTWTVVQALNAPTSSNIIITTPGLYRWICTAYTSGTANTTIQTLPASKYNVYVSTPWNVGVFGYIGQSFSNTFNDTNIEPNISQQPPVAIPMFQTSSDWPAVCGAFQQRVCFANTVNQPATCWMSAIGLITSFLVALPETDSMAVQFTIAGKQVQYIQALVDMGRLIIHTSSGEYLAAGNQSNAITPSAIGLALQGTQGSQLINPVQIGITGIYVQSRGTIIRDLQYSIYTNTFIGKDTTIFSPQIFDGQTILYLDWQQILHSIVWAVLSNGQIASMTYSKDEDVWGWNHHDTINGSVEQLCVVPENTQDAVYVVVNRTIEGQTVRYIERMANRDFQDTQYLTDAVFTDCSLTYDGRNKTSNNVLLQLSGGGWTVQDHVQVSITTPTFSSGSVGQAVVVQLLANGTQINPVNKEPYPIGLVIDSVTMLITTYQNSMSVLATPSKNVPVWAQDTDTTSWGIAKNTFSGLTQLAGQAISGLGDGNVVMNALTDETPTVVSSGGTFTTPDAQNYLVLTVGLPMLCDLQTLPIPDHKTIQDTPISKEMVVQEVTPVFYQTRGVSMGSSIETLRPMEQRGVAMEPMGQPVALFTGPWIEPIAGTWNNQGSVFLRQYDPLPLGISAIVTTAQAGN